MAFTPAWRSGHSPRRMPTLLLFLLASPSVLDLAAAADAPQCFFPDGSVDSSGVVCDVNQAKATGGASACCSKFDSCYGNGLCLNDWNNATIWYRNSCTDKTFGNVACGNFCATESDDKNKPVWLQQCDMVNKKGCCARGNTNCCTSTNSSSWFDFHPGMLTVVLNGDGSNRLTARLSSGSAANNPNANSSPTPGAASASVTPIAAALEAIQTAEKSADDSRRNGVVIGAVLGAILGLALLGTGLMAWKFFAVRKENTKLRQRVKLYEEAAGDGWGAEGRGSQSAPASRDGTHVGPGSVWTAPAGASGRTSPVEAPNSPSQKSLAVPAVRAANSGWRQSGQSNWSVASFIAAGGKTVGPGGVSSSSNVAKIPKELPGGVEFPKELQGDVASVGAGISRQTTPMVPIPEADAAREREREKEEEASRGHTGIMP